MITVILVPNNDSLKASFLMVRRTLESLDTDMPRYSRFTNLKIFLLLINGYYLTYDHSETIISSEPVMRNDPIFPSLTRYFSHFVTP